MQKNRRDFLRETLLLTTGAALVACERSAPPPTQKVPSKSPESPPMDSTPLPDGLNEENFIVHNPRPLALESLRDTIGMGVITASSRLFVRNNLPMPDTSIIKEAERWVLEIAGVNNPQSLSLAKLKRMGFVNLCAVLQCSGNGRAFYEHEPSGSQWATGAAGCVMWGGVALSTVLAACGGVKEGVRYVTATGGEPLPEDVPRDKSVVERSIPIEKGLDDCLLAWELNGEPIPISHGGPLRLVVPGYFGCNQIKYVKSIEASPTQSKAKIQQTGYRFRPIGEKGDPDQPSMWRMPVKSWIVSAQKTSAREAVFNGVAFSGERGIERVEYSTDGETWTLASLYGPDLGKNAWRRFQFKTNVPPEASAIYTRAADTKGDTQPELRAENERGYGNNSWRDHGHQMIQAASTEEVVVANNDIDSQTAAEGKEVFLKSSPPCGACHTLDDAQTAGLVGPNLDQLNPEASRVERAVRNGVGSMPAYEDVLSESEIKAVAEYVAHVSKK